MKRLLKAGLMWKIGLPAALIALVVVGVAFQPIFLISGIGGSSDSETGTGTPVGTGISDAVPEEYRAMILRAGTICEDVTPDIIAAQIEAESNWNPNAVSPVGAAGLTQFMPATWTSHGKDGDGDGRADITNPADAIWSQGNYMCLLRGLVTGYVENGQASGTVIDLTLAAYNAGQGNVLAYGGVPPFSETQNYVKKILELAAGKYSAGPVYTGAGSSAIVDAAMKYLGLPYRGEGPGGIDCCIFVWHAVKDALGIELDLYTPGNPDVIAKCEWTFQNMSGKYGAVQVPATLDSLQPGDLLFHQASDTPYSVDAVTHVSIYIGDGKIIDSAPGGGVKIRSIAYYSQSDPLVGPAVRFPAR